MVGRNKNPKYNINKNVLVIGGSGSGKTRFHVKPNLMQMNASYIVTDPKGTVVEECGKMLQRGGYEIKILNTINFKQSMRYNPFKYIYCENDILKLVNCIMENTKGEDSKGGEDFWAKAEALYYQALIAYIWYEAPEEEKNMTTLLEMLNASEVREDDETFKNAVDLMFEQLESRDPDQVFAQLCSEVERLRREGIDPEAFQRCKRASYGRYIGMFGRVEAVAGLMMQTHFAGMENMYQLVDWVADATLEELTQRLWEDFDPQRAALSVISPAREG